MSYKHYRLVPRIDSSGDAIGTTASPDSVDYLVARGMRELDAGGGILKMLHARKENALIEAAREADLAHAMAEAEAILKLL